MTDKEKSVEKGILARTATYTTKTAKRAQTKLKQKVGKGDETKDEVFDEFVANFNKQQAAVTSLNAELRNYLRCITAMQLAAENFSAAMKNVYEPEWSSREAAFELFENANSNWTNLSKRLTEEVLEPLMSYQKPFIEVKTKIQKRARKLVDYDHSRHTVDTLRAKGAAKVNDSKKLNQAEEDYQKAKEVFIDLTSELYDELPALYDSRIGFYATSFQSIFTLEEVFHREAARLKHELNDLMDQLITDFSAGTFSTRKPFCSGIETSSNTSEKEDNDLKLTGSLTQFYDVAVPSDELDGGVELPTELKFSKNKEDSEHSEESDRIVDKSASLPIQPIRPAPIPPARPSTPPSRPKPPLNSTIQQNVNQETQLQQIETEINIASKEETKVLNHPNKVPSNEENMSIGADNVIAYRNIKTPDNPSNCNLVVPKSLYKVVTTHKYTPEDEDELSFEKGEIIHVIPYDDPEEQDDGWLMGVMDSNGFKGVFPENFSKRYDT